MKNKKAFTLAEVLIVLALVGFLFTLTIPNLVQKQGSLEYIKKAKQMQKDLQTALTEVSAINGNKNPDDWETVRTSENKAEAITNELSKKIKVLSSKITKVGKQAFKKTNVKLKIQVPKKKLKKYRKLFQGKGLGKKANIV